MTFNKPILTSLFISGTFFFAGCGDTANLNEGSYSGEGFIYNGHNFGQNRNVDFKQGVKDGCKTSTGAYTKNHALFNNSNSYHTGWEDGRMNCKGN